MIILSLITLIAIIQAYRSYPVSTAKYTCTTYLMETFISDEALRDFMPSEFKAGYGPPLPIFPTTPTKRA